MEPLQNPAAFIPISRSVRRSGEPTSRQDPQIRVTRQQAEVCGFAGETMSRFAKAVDRSQEYGPRLVGATLEYCRAQDDGRDDVPRLR